MICRGFTGTGASKIKVVRLFNTFGPRQYPRAVIPKMAREALKCLKDPGHRPRFGDPAASRAFIPVSFSVRALFAARLLPLNPISQYGGGAPAISISETWKTIAEVLGVDPGRAVWRCTELMRSSYTVKSLQGESSEALKAFDMVSPIDAMSVALGQLLEWVEAHPNYCADGEYQ
jgi:nucleoside-diphosphate-sugar epimerase